MKSAEEMARMVWAFVAAAGGLVVGLDPEDEMKLLRLRTKKQEFVIVPGERRLLRRGQNVRSLSHPLTSAHWCRLKVSVSRHTRDATSVTFDLWSMLSYILGSGITIEITIACWRSDLRCS